MIRTPMPKVKSKEITSKIRDPLTLYFIAIGPKRILKNGGRSGALIPGNSI